MLLVYSTGIVVIVPKVFFFFSNWFVFFFSLKCLCKLTYILLY